MLLEKARARNADGSFRRSSELDRLMKSMKMTSKRLAWELELSATTVRFWRKSKRPPPLVVLKYVRMMHALRTTEK